jgi:hypothetical protein
MIFFCSFEEDSNQNYLITKSAANLDISNNAINCDLPQYYLQSNLIHKTSVSLIVNNSKQASPYEIYIYPISNVYNLTPRECNNLFKLVSFKGNTKLTITGDNFYPNPEANIYCKFIFNTINEYIVMATILNTETLYCRAPDTFALYGLNDNDKKGELIVSQIDGLFYNNYKEIVYSFRDPVLITVSPGYTYVNERTGVTVKGNYFRNKKNLYIRFTYKNLNSVLIKPVFIDSSTLFFLIPETFELFTYLYSYPAVVNIDLTNNLSDYSNSLDFEYFNMPQLLSINPNL